MKITLKADNKEEAEKLLNGKEELTYVLEKDKPAVISLILMQEDVGSTVITHTTSGPALLQELAQVMMNVILQSIPVLVIPGVVRGVEQAFAQMQQKAMMAADLQKKLMKPPGS